MYVDHLFLALDYVLRNKSVKQEALGEDGR